MRRACLRTSSFTVAKLDWRRAGAAWAMDYTKPDEPVEGGAVAILSVRDLASRYRLLELPVLHADAATTVLALERLFHEHGAPLVLKSDNGSHFTGADVVALLERWGVLHLRSPVRTPTYNGSVESAIGWFKDSVRHTAARNGHPGLWTEADIEDARRLANDTLRPWGVNGPTPTEFWSDRLPIEDGERDGLRARAAAIEHELLASGVAGPKKARRDAIRQASDEYGILVMGRRRVRLSRRQLMTARIP